MSKTIKLEYNNEAHELISEVSGAFSDMCWINSGTINSLNAILMRFGDAREKEEGARVSLTIPQTNFLINLIGSLHDCKAFIDTGKTKELARVLAYLRNGIKKQ